MYRFCVKFIFLTVQKCAPVQYTLSKDKLMSDSLYSHAIKVIMLEETQYIMFVSR